MTVLEIFCSNKQSFFYCNRMGLIQNRIENLESAKMEFKKVLSINEAAMTDAVFDFPEESIDENCFPTAPITLPEFYTKPSPFRLYSMTTAMEEQNLPSSSIQEGKRENLEEREDSSIEMYPIVVQQNHSWIEVIYHSTLFSRILGYLSTENDCNLMLVNHRVFSEVYLQRLLFRDNNWLVPVNHIKSNPQFEQIYAKLSQYEEESEHSLDLDRTESFFCNQAMQNVDKGGQLAKLDRIMKSLTAFSVPYSQGINSVVAKLLSFFEEETAYWIVIFLLQKTKNIQNDCAVYQNFMEDLEQRVTKKVPKVVQKLDELDFNVEYFAMKWVMSLFSYDLHKETLYYLWDLLLTFDGILTMKIFIISIFEQLQLIILTPEYDRDQINSLLKHQMKETISNQMGRKILDRTRIYLVQEKYGQNFINFYNVSGKIPNQNLAGIEFTQHRKYSRNSDDNNFMHLLQSPKAQKFNKKIEQQAQELEQSNYHLPTEEKKKISIQNEEQISEEGLKQGHKHKQFLEIEFQQLEDLLFEGSED